MCTGTLVHHWKAPQRYGMVTSRDAKRGKVLCALTHMFNFILGTWGSWSLMGSWWTDCSKRGEGWYWERLEICPQWEKPRKREEQRERKSDRQTGWTVRMTDEWAENRHPWTLNAMLLTQPVISWTCSTWFCVCKCECVFVRVCVCVCALVSVCLVF